MPIAACSLHQKEVALRQESMCWLECPDEMVGLATVELSVEARIPLGHQCQEMDLIEGNGEFIVLPRVVNHTKIWSGTSRSARMRKSRLALDLIHFQYV